MQGSAVMLLFGPLGLRFIMAVSTLARIAIIVMAMVGTGSGTLASRGVIILKVIESE